MPEISDATEGEIIDLARELSENYSWISYEDHEEIVRTVLYNYLGPGRLLQWYEDNEEKLTQEFIKKIKDNDGYWHNVANAQDDN
jgi:hypothetical protein